MSLPAIAKSFLETQLMRSGGNFVLIHCKRAYRRLILDLAVRYGNACDFVVEILLLCYMTLLFELTRIKLAYHRLLANSPMPHLPSQEHGHFPHQGAVVYHGLPGRLHAALVSRPNQLYT